jgi:addiction module RelE/StbE family toxin
MNIDFARSFDNQFSKLSGRQKQLAREAIELFAENPMDNSLLNHPLKDKWSQYRSITADDDLRLHFRLTSEDRALFVAIGTHGQLYK